MLLEPDRKVLEGLSALQADPHFAPVLDWLRESLDATRENNDILEGNPLTRSQGAAITLSELVDVLERVDARYEALITRARQGDRALE